MSSRRDFVQQSATALGAMALGPLARTGTAHALTQEPEIASHSPVAPLNILILGGTGFTGPHQVRYAVQRGHKVTVFNRGRRQADLPASVEHLVGDRQTGDLASIQKANRSWDVVIDNPTTLPFWVRDAGQVLKGKTKHYIFISTISTYAHYRTAGMDENYELAAYTGTEDPLTIKQATGGLYGPLKVLSEKEAEKWFTGMVTVIRPGLIVGPGDETDRFSYWPVRIERGGEVAAPGNPEDPTQIIDARDLAEWTIRMAEQRTLGIYNATGPRSALSMAEMLYGIRAVMPGSHDIKFTWLPVDFLAEQKVRGWSDMPTWLPMTGENKGWGRVSIARALEKGLTFRPLADTTRDLLAWFKTQPAERQATLRAGLKPEREAEVLAAWHAKPKS
ncbi:MAG: NAD-dependent epimerase/dehydratase family protein [Gemmatimonadaceae bacterium]